MESNLFLYALCIAIIAVVYRCILAHEDILNWWFRFGLRFEKHSFYRPIWGCEKCFAGQISFWIYIILWVRSYFDGNSPFSAFVFKMVGMPVKNEFSLFSGLTFVSSAILFTTVLSYIYQRFIK